LREEKAREEVISKRSRELERGRTIEKERKQTAHRKLRRTKYHRKNWFLCSRAKDNRNDDNRNNTDIIVLK